VGEDASLKLCIFISLDGFKERETKTIATATMKEKIKEKPRLLLSSF
jgi:hypothetical protein